MQPAAEHSPWPRRIMIAGLVLGFVGVIGFSLIFDDFREYYDPREMSEYTVDSDTGTNTVLNLSSGCWVVNVEGDDSDYDVTFQYVENGAAAGDVSEDCRSDFQASSGDADFSKLTTLDVEKTSQVLVIIDCEEEDGCQNPLYFTNSEDVLFEMAGDFGLWAVLGTCCIGGLLFPLGWLLVSINKSKDAKVQLTQQQMVTAMDPLERELNSNQEILTTDQLYKLVRGEVPEMDQRQANVPGPFSDADTRVRTQTPKKTGGSINKASAYTHENPPTDESWKSWDES